MEIANQTNDDQTRLWNGGSGCAWIDAKEVLDQMFEPFETLLVEVVAEASRRNVLDVGCGTGATTLAVARSLGKEGRCVGIDISNPMIAVARAHAEREGVPADFICGDAQVHPFEAASYDMFISRFGVMFFEDPIAAFTNLRRAATEDAQLRMIVWRSAAENPFMTTAERAAAPLLPNLPPRLPDAPGQFAFANDARVSKILQESGWAEIDLRAIDVACALPEKELLRYVTRLGPVGMALQDADEETRARVVEPVRAAFAPYVHGDQVRYTAACWMIGAQARPRTPWRRPS